MSNVCLVFFGVFFGGEIWYTASQGGLLAALTVNGNVLDRNNVGTNERFFFFFLGSSNIITFTVF